MHVTTATGEDALFAVGDEVRIAKRYPIGHYRVPFPLRGAYGVVEMVMLRAIDNEEEAYGRNAGAKRHYYRVAVPLRGIWSNYGGADADSLRIEIFETWLARI